ncbi:MAG TPA: hypothetical protein VFH78_01255 [Candidatus Thermoplasmatota archaeon]|nr:hypothetical protein [Candidatus Thermoplasmatota archaeon]
MLRSNSLLALAAVTLLAAPAHATWMYAGSYEPSTSYDTEDWMWQTAPAPGEKKIYFSGMSQYLAVTDPATLNPNVGLLETRIEVSNAEHHEAFLGVWVDCNGDGYIGLAESALREYPASLLLDDAVCPATLGPANGWTAGAHNYNNWVSELIPIGRDGLIAVDRRMYIDDEARVWADHHRPDEAPWIRPCPVGPQPRGTYQSTGGFLNFLDCRVDILGVANLVLAETGDPLGWRFADPDDARTGFLGQHATFGNESEEHRAVTVWDCSRQTRVGDVLNQTPVGPLTPSALNSVHNMRVAEPSPEVENTDDPVRRVAATVNHTYEGFMVLGGTGRDCDTSNDFGHDLYDTWCGTTPYCIGEGDRVGSDPKNKKESHFNMGFETAPRGSLPWAAPTPLNLHGSGGASGDTAGLTWGGSRWSAGSYWSTKPGFGTIRTQLSDLEGSRVEVSPGYWLTFYAYVGEATLERGLRLPGGEGVYGSWQCGSNTSGIHNGWNCDRDAWYVNPDGSPYQPTVPAELERHELARPGDPYNLRDVDCYDGGIGALGLGVQPAYYGPEPCT